MAATDRLVNDIDDAVEWPLGGGKGREVVSGSMIFMEGLKLVMKC